MTFQEFCEERNPNLSEMEKIGGFARGILSQYAKGTKGYSDKRRKKLQETVDKYKETFDVELL